MTVYIVACSASKHPNLRGQAMQAREAYTGPAFRIARRRLEAAGARWFILSARYGFLLPETAIKDYDQLIATDENELKCWDGVFDHLSGDDGADLVGAKRLICLGSARYCDAAAIVLERPDIGRPIAGMHQGVMLRVLNSLTIEPSRPS